MDKNKKMLRQGDVLLIPTDKIPGSKCKTTKKCLALGEITGHHHSIFGSGAVGYADSEDALCEFLTVTEPVELEHQEHLPVTIPVGDYQVVIQKEYTPAAVRNVRD